MYLGFVLGARDAAMAVRFVVTPSSVSDEKEEGNDPTDRHGAEPEETASTDPSLVRNGPEDSAPRNADCK